MILCNMVLSNIDCTSNNFYLHMSIEDERRNVSDYTALCLCILSLRAFTMGPIEYCTIV